MDHGHALEISHEDHERIIRVQAMARGRKARGLKKRLVELDIDELHIDGEGGDVFLCITDTGSATGGACETFNWEAAVSWD